MECAWECLWFLKTCCVPERAVKKTKTSVGRGHIHHQHPCFPLKKNDLIFHCCCCCFSCCLYPQLAEGKEFARTVGTVPRPTCTFLDRLWQNVRYDIYRILKSCAHPLKKRGLHLQDAVSWNVHQDEDKKREGIKLSDRCAGGHRWYSSLCFWPALASDKNSARWAAKCLNMRKKQGWSKHEDQQRPSRKIERHD